MEYVKANWTAPNHIRAYTTTRALGFSQGCFKNNNLGLHVGDSPRAVQQNRDQLIHALALTCEPIWLNQTHSNRVVYVEGDQNRNADASVTQRLGQALAVLTADCLPILLTNQDGSEIAAIHAGWRGLISGVIEKTIGRMQSAPNDCLAWIGPGLCQRCFFIREDVLPHFTKHPCFTPNVLVQFDQQQWQCNLALLAKSILNSIGIAQTSLSHCCTYEQSDVFYSYRRDGKTGRMASLIWIEPTSSNHNL